MKKFFPIIFFLILLSCSNKNYSIEKKSICNISQNKNILEVNCNEYNEPYYIKYNNLNKTFFECKKISFDIYEDNEITKKSYLECYSKDNKKKIFLLD
tara:strand:+ start:914 stop:1207 length:294 start_codon:yes stop_codon:yes gene_type:complete